MTYIIIGTILLITAIIFLRLAIKGGDKEGIIGLAALIVAALILIVFFGLVFRALL
jgi:hypothetical protein